MALTPMARLPSLIRTRFESLRYSSIAQENIYKGNLFHPEIVCCVYSLESPHPGDSNEYTQHTIIMYKIEKVSLNYPHLLPDLTL